MNVKRVEDLRQVADETLSGLEAGPALRSRILNAREAPKKRAVPVYRWAAALSFALVLAIVLPLTLGGGGGTLTAGPDMTGEGVIRDHAAGEGTVGNERASLRNSQVNVTTRNEQGAGGIWDGSGSSFRLVGVNGRYYRLLSGVELDGGRLGELLGTVSVHTDQPALSGEEGIVSNHALAGTEVWAVQGMGGTLVCCTVDGRQCLYQRVSYSGRGLVGSESRLTDVMQIRGHVTAISLTGRPVIEGSEAERLFGILADRAEFAGNGSRSGRQVLIITLDNGAALQMTVDGDQLSGCGQWSCPEFFEALNQR